VFEAASIVVKIHSDSALKFTERFLAWAVTGTLSACSTLSQNSSPWKEIYSHEIIKKKIIAIKNDSVFHFQR
jgi:hypothetical protein